MGKIKQLLHNTAQEKILLYEYGYLMGGMNDDDDDRDDDG
jgi:hypothetical protein